MKNIIKIIIPTIIILSILLLSGCVGEEKQNNVTETPIQTPQPPGVNIEAPQGWESPKEVVELSKKDAISRFNLSESDIQIDSVIPVEWMDTSLGYPEPGKEPGKDYPIEIIRGYTILLYAKGNLYEYHSDYHRIMPPTGPAPVIGDLENMPRIVKEKDDSSLKIIELIKEDLISRYHVLEQDIGIVNIIRTIWPDKRLGIPQPDVNYPQEDVPGYVILVTDGNNTYEYHTDYEHAVLYKMYKNGQDFVIQ